MTIKTGDVWEFDPKTATLEQIEQAIRLLGEPIVKAMLAEAAKPDDGVIQQFVVTAVR